MNRRSFFFLAFFGLTGLSTLAQDAARQFTVAPFDRLNVGSALNVEIRQGAFNVEADVPPGESKYLIVKSENGVLTARMDRPAREWLNIGSRKSPRLIVTMPELKGLTLSGAADAVIRDGFTTTELTLNLSGASDLSTSNLTAKRIRLNASGASDIRLRGTTQVLEADLSGASDLMAYDLMTEEAIIRAQGASDAHVNVRQRLDMATRGGADVSYRGKPQQIVTKKLGSDE